jgi:hypothetical protein
MTNKLGPNIVLKSVSEVEQCCVYYIYPPAEACELATIETNTSSDKRSLAKLGMSSYIPGSKAGS